MPCTLAVFGSDPMARDDFSLVVKDTLAKRVNLRCSNPNCRQPTSGPHSKSSRSLNIGVAAHMAAAAQNGPRFDSALSTAERKSHENGIWLCQSCGKLIDNDAAAFPIALLRQWKSSAEANALQGVRGQASDSLPQPVTAKHSPIPRLYGVPYPEARSLLLDSGWQPKMRHWSEGTNPDICGGNGPYFWSQGFHEIVNACPTGVSPCSFGFRDVYGHSLLVFTVGEVIEESLSQAVVTGWRFENDEGPA